MYDIYKIINYLCEGYTISEACYEFRCSKSYIMKELRKIRTPGTNYYNEILAEKLKLAMAKNSLRGQKNGGTISRKDYVLTDEKAKELKELKETKNLSYRDLEEMTGIPYSTIRLAIERIKDDNREEIGRGR